MAAAQSLDPKLVPANIGALVDATGWLASSLRSKKTDTRRRVERMRDVQTALAAEILPYIESLELFDLADHLDDVIDRMRLDKTYLPVVHSERNDTIFRAILSDIHVLPERVIRPVVRYYSQLCAIEAIIDDLRSDAFQTMREEQREAIYADYIGLKIEALALGRRAVDAIDVELQARQ